MKPGLGLELRFYLLLLGAFIATLYVLRAILRLPKLKLERRRALSLSIFVLAGIILVILPPRMAEWLPEGVDCTLYFQEKGRGPVNAWERKDVYMEVNPWGSYHLCVALFWGHIALFVITFGLGILV
jgi:hypothetical protein